MRQFRLIAIALAALGLVFGGTSQVALAGVEEAYLFTTGGEVAHLPEMDATGAYGTLITRSGQRWVVKTGSIDVNSKGQAVEVGTTGGAQKTVPANSKMLVAEHEGTLSAPGPHTVNPKSNEIQVGITHHDMGSQGRKNKPVRMIMHDNCNFSMVAPYRINWQTGTALIYAPTGIVVDTNEGIVHAPPGSVFVLATSFGGVRVMNCSVVAPITFLRADREQGVSVAGSEELFVCNHRPLPFEVTPEDGVGRKSIKLTDMGAEMTAVTSEFSIPSMMRSPSYVKEWTRDGGINTQLAKDLLKTAAVVSFARRSTQSFYVTPPRSNTF
jgi:hypothetical protein